MIDEAIAHYSRAIELGDNRSAVARRLVGLLNQRDDSARIDRVIEMLSERGRATGDLATATALKAMRQQDYDRGIALARQAFSESSTSFADHVLLGQFYQAARRTEEAGKELRRAVELGPAVPITWVSYVQYLVREKQLDQAKAAVAAARRALPAERARLPMAQCYAMLGELKEAESMIQEALQSPACDLRTIRVAVDLYINLGRFDQVEPILDKLQGPTLDASPETLAWAKRTRSLARLSTGRLAEMDRALDLVEENLKADPASAADLKLKAIIMALRTSTRGEATKLLETLDKQNLLATNEQFILARACLADGLVEKYHAEMLKIMGHPVKNPQHVVHFVDFLLAREELDQAQLWLAELKRLVPRSVELLARESRLLDPAQRKPELLELLMARGREAPDQIATVAALLERFGFVSEAEAAYKAHIARKPGESERLLGLAAFLARQDRSKEALALLEAAWTTCRPEAVAETSLPLFSARSADNEVKRRVLAWVTGAIEKSPAAAGWLRTKLGRIYFNEGRFDEAEGLFRQALASDSEQIEAMNDLAWELALREPAKPREALALIDRAIEKAGPIPSLVDTRAVALIRVGDPERAAAELTKAQAADPRNLSLAVHIAWAYRASGKNAEAREALQHAEELGLRAESRGVLERDIIGRLRRELADDQPRSGARDRLGAGT